jgi:hypothetical protein
MGQWPAVGNKEMGFRIYRLQGTGLPGELERDSATWSLLLERDSATWSLLSRKLVKTGTC